MATYFGSKPVSDWTANGSAETGHDFINQINRQQADIDTAKNEYQEQKGKVETAEQVYNDLFNNRTSYGDFYDQAKGSEGVNEAKEQYQKSLNAVNATNSAMNTLPSSINANSNVVLTANQRNAALGNQMAKYQNTMDYWTRQNAGDQSMYQTALGAAQNKAGQLLAQQQADIAEARTNYQSKMEQLNQMYQNVLNEKNVVRSIYGDMYDDEYNHMQQQIQIWAENLQAETARYAQAQENYRTQLQIDAQNKALDWQKYMDQQNMVSADKQARQAFNANLADVYAQYKSEIDDLNRQTKDFGTYINPFGSNGMIGSLLGFNDTATQARNLQNKGFEDYLYNYNPQLQKMLREDYSDLLSAYGLE